MIRIRSVVHPRAKAQSLVTAVFAAEENTSIRLSSLSQYIVEQKYGSQIQSQHSFVSNFNP